VHRTPIKVYRLPPYRPSLNLSERLLRHLERTIVANVLDQVLD
jgi:hypothetical protein